MAAPAHVRRRVGLERGRERRVIDIYREHFGDPRRERLFLSSAGFFVTFATVRAITHAIRSDRFPIGNVSEGGTHIHHLVWGILGLLGVGYAWDARLATGDIGQNRDASRATAVAYGAASALTLDEFALWLNLEDDYWSKEGRQSIDAIVLFGSLLSIGSFGGRFLQGVLRKAVRSARFW